MDPWDVWRIALPLIIVLVSFVIGLIVKRTAVKRLANLAAKSKSKLDDIFMDSLRSVLPIWFALLGVFISIAILPLDVNEKHFLETLFQTLLIFSLFWFFIKLIGKISVVYFDKKMSKLPAASIIKNSIKFVLFSIGFLILLQTMGISVTPIITTLGVGGLAVALALQDTLANLFAGFHIIASQRVKPKDYIRLDSGEEGYVVDINWRDTVLRQLQQNHIIIPNSKLSSAVVINYYRPKRSMNVLVEVGVDYSSDLEMVERITMEVAQQALMNVPGGVNKFDSFMRYHTFADSSINFSVYLRCEEFFDKFLLQHEFIKLLKKRYDQEGINIPFPIRTVIMQPAEKEVELD